MLIFIVLPAYAGMIEATLFGLCLHRVLPAYAGMIDTLGLIHRSDPCAPRVCGDDPMDLVGPCIVAECSPRMRG